MPDLDYSQLKDRGISRSWRASLAGATRVVPPTKSQLQSARRRDRRAEAGLLTLLANQDARQDFEQPHHYGRQGAGVLGHGYYPLLRCSTQPVG